jgi:hypothetical protein
MVLLKHNRNHWYLKCVIYVIEKARPDLLLYLGIALFKDWSDWLNGWEVAGFLFGWIDCAVLYILNLMYWTWLLWCTLLYSTLLYSTLLFCTETYRTLPYLTLPHSFVCSYHVDWSHYFRLIDLLIYWFITHQMMIYFTPLSFLFSLILTNFDTFFSTWDLQYLDP